MKRAFVLGLLAGLVGPWATAAAQTGVPGGLQGVGAWNEACGTTRTFVNNTGLKLGGLWVAINNNGAVDLPEIGTISVDNLGATLNWDVDDNENLVNTGEGDETDGSPTSSSGWHRAQARFALDAIAPGQSFTLRLCDSAGNAIGGRTIFIIPMAPIPGQIGGDLSRRTELPFGVKAIAPFGSVTIEPIGAPPFSDDFAVNVTNTDPTLFLKQLKITPPGGSMVQDASASGGGTYNSGLSAIVWSTPVPPGGSSQLNVDLDMLVRPLTTTVQFEAIQFVTQPTGVPALPRWALVMLAGGLALVGLALVRRRAA